MEKVEACEMFLSPWEIEMAATVYKGIYDYKSRKTIRGFLDAHVHLDRVMTYNGRYFPPSMNLSEIADLPLKAKQDLIGFLHDGEAYTEASLKERMARQIKRAIASGTREVWGVIDTTTDIGLRAFSAAQAIKEEYRKEIGLKVSCYPLFGFKNYPENRERYDLLAQAAPDSDFIVGLPEKDDEPDKVGFKGHVKLILDLAYKNKKPVHIHVDQMNSATQRDSFRAISVLEGLDPEALNWFTAKGVPKIWLVHVISPSCYDGELFSLLVRLLLKHNIGVIVCPFAGISMRNLRSESAPIHNSLARVLEFLKAGIPVRLGTDNVNDYLVPSGTGSILREVTELSNVARHSAIHILAKVSMGIELNNGDRSVLGKALYEADKAYSRHRESMEEIQKINKGIIFEF
jgi:cytosine/adenosine deaminase-related metal-dependent hydrolase